MKKTFNPWPTAIIAAFLILIAGLAAFITVASRQPMDLVRSDYYEEEILYQRQIDRLERTRPWQDQASITYEAGAVTVRLPSVHAQRGCKGTIQLYRPSNAALDQSIPLQLDGAGSQRVGDSGLAPGLWKVRVFWALNAGPAPPAGALEYYLDRTIVIGGRGS